MSPKDPTLSEELLQRQTLYVMAVDPGEQTGWALSRFNLPPQDLNLELLQLGTQPFEEMLNDVRTWSILSATVDVFVVETYPSRQSEPEQMERVLRLSELIADKFMPASKIYLMAPPEWKPFAKAQKWKVDGNTPHEKDAYNIMRFFVFNELNIDIGDHNA